MDNTNFWHREICSMLFAVLAFLTGLTVYVVCQFVPFNLPSFIASCVSVILFIISYNISEQED